ncbi:hypothetical protein D5R81_03065 [Parashewanella spongiae]|uniref:Uncharacterized protein n=1 Tax=Parashewanella spongiae TaxID=342950 RepID=A0A3A6U475_9GAMM|nr:hypothetical protein [Parashewanella spongiae]MCL1076952.1 hypothetical protein [Parashewanella spongiae]RJY18932.1 hypothetical protein D5R81_03065 [Parashewanella spongiae]
MSNQINVGRTHHPKLPEDKHENKSEPQSGAVSQFLGMLMPVQEKAEGDSGISKKVLESAKSVLSQHGGVCKVGSAEVTRNGDMLHYRLLNGPMMGLIIQANYDKKGIRLSLFPKNARQATAIQNVLPNLSQNLKGRRHPISLNLMAVKGK